ncbi:TPA: DNA (cytosine-5-)-methyltransferase [Streptococcus agalactiae]
MKFLDLFAGIGGFRLGLESQGHECLGFCEIDKFARKSYKAIFETEGEVEFHDIRQVTDQDFRKFRGQVDIICVGFPCQAFSLAGRRLGFEDTRGTLFFELARAAQQIQPRFLFLENVKGLLSHDKGATFRTILTTLDELGYDVEWQVLNSKDFQVPQNRERVFLIGHSRRYRPRFLFPLRREGSPTAFVQTGRVYDISGISPTITTMQGGDKVPKILLRETLPHLKIKEATKTGFAKATLGDSVNLAYPKSNSHRGRVGQGISNTLTTSGNMGVVVAALEYRKDKWYEVTGIVLDGKLYRLRIRRLTPRECFRLQGFPDWAYERAEAVSSKSQLYKQAGNSVTVNVIAAIAEKFRKIEEEEHETLT